MNAVAGWIQANQRFIVLELRRLAARLRGDAKAERTLGRQIAAAAAKMSAPAAIDILAGAFGLSAFERELLLLCAGMELDSEISGALAAAGHGRAITFSLALATLKDAHWSALTPARPLRRWRLIEPVPGQELTAAPLRVDERILHFIAGVNSIDARLEPLLSRRSAPALMAGEHQALAERIAAQWGGRREQQRLIHFIGDDYSGAEDIAAAAATAAGHQLYVVSAENISPLPIDQEEVATLWVREAVLLPAALFIQCGEGAPPTHLGRFIARLPVQVFLSSRDPLHLGVPVLLHELHKPGPTEQKSLWRRSLGAVADSCDGELEGIASQFRLSTQTIALAAEAAKDRIATGEAATEALRSVCRATGRRRLDELASRIDVRASWDDLVLPGQQITILHHIVAQVRQRRRVYDEWGFGRRSDRGLGVAVLFSGESGTGKTLAAEILASDLNLDLYRIDLSSVVSKYIGETEKNLRRVFDAAEDSGAVLLFDEADALFGKRSEVKDSHDRYANIETSYLLQRMEAYHGLAILTTNLKSALDTAFQRRLRFIVQFPFPDAEQREAIWRRAFPSDAPTEELDFGKLARLNIAGGSVRNISLNAAFLAAEAGEKVGMRHLLQAAQIDRAKLERPLSEMETRGWV